MRRVATSLLLVFLATMRLGALDPSRSLFQCVHDAWRQREGLAVDTVNCLAQAADGFLFVGTEDGLFRFDGVRFTRFDRANTPAIRDNLIAALERDDRGVLWIGMIRGGGLAYYENGRIARLPAGNGVDGKGVTAICGDGNGGIWVGTWGDGLLHVQRGKVRQTYSRRQGLGSDVVFALLRARNGDLWIGHWGGGLSRLSNGRLQRFGAGEGLGCDVVWSLFEDDQRRLWAATRRGLYRFRNGRFRLQGSDKEIVRALLQDRNGNVWLGTWGGVRRLADPPGAAFTARDGLAADTVRCMVEDREGSLWVGTFRGLSRFRDGVFRVCGRREGLGGDLVQAICPGRAGRVWLGVDGAGLYEYRDGSFVHHPIESGRVADSVLSLAEDGVGRLWIAGTGGVVLYAGGRVQASLTWPFRGEDNYARLVYPDRQGTVWVAAAKGGLHRLAGDATLTMLATSPGIASLTVGAMLQGRGGTYWFGTDRGLLRIADLDAPLRGNPLLLPRRDILALCEDGQRGVWVGADDGLHHIAGGCRAASAPVKGLGSGPVFAVVDDSRGNLWLATPAGIIRAGLDELRAAAASGRHLSALRRFDNQDGLRSPSCNGIGRPAAVMTHAGEIWFATHEGVAIARPERLLANPVRPQPVIEEIIAGEKRRPYAPEVTLEPGEDRISLRFTVPSLRAPNRVCFRFRLDGVDGEWRNEAEVNRQRRVEYAGIPPGRHRFRLVAVNDSGRAGPELSLALNLPSRLYQRAWFVSALLAAGAAALAGALVWRRRRRRLQRRPPLTGGDVAAWRNRLSLFMAEEKPHLDPSLRLADLADRLGLSPHQLSQVVNEGFGVNFNEFVNNLRIEEAKRMLADPHCREYKLLTVAFESGFSSKATFNQTFKKLTGATPSQFRASCQSGAEKEA